MKKILKVVMFSHEFPPFLGGVGKIAYDLIKLTVKKDNVCLITKRQKDILKIKNVQYKEVFVFPKIWFISYALFYYFNKKIFDEADVIYLNEAAPTIVAGMFFSKKHLKKSVVIAHGLEVEGVLQNKSVMHRLFGIRKRYEEAIKYSKKLITLSHAMQKKITKVIPVFADKIEWCYLGVDTEEFKYIKEVSSRYSKYKNKIIIGSCSRIIVEKGYIEMVNVMVNVINKKSDIIWLIAGDGSDKSTIEAYVNKLNIEKNVYFLGKLTFKELSEFYSRIDIFMLLSNYDEVFPLVYIEAQMCGALPIGNNKGGVVEVIDQNGYGFLLNNQKEAESIILNYRGHNREELISHAKRFDISNNFEKWLETIQK